MDEWPKSPVHRIFRGFESLSAVTYLTLEDEMSESETRKPSIADKVAEAKKHLICNCDLDNWEPELNTGHSWVCRIHKAVMNGTWKQP